MSRPARPPIRWLKTMPLLAGIALAGPAMAQPTPANTPTPAPQVPDAAGGQPDKPGPGAPPASDRYAPEPLPFADPESIAPYVALLNQEDFQARQTAVQFMLESPSIGVKTIEPYLTDPALPPESRSRLLAVAEMLFRVEPRAAMGVQFDRQSSPVILRSFPDSPFFRAREVLVEGDQVVGADGRQIESIDDFQGAILSHEPGETMRLRVIRSGRTLEVDVPLGDYTRLGLSLPPTSVLDTAWEFRLQRIVGENAGALAPAIDCRADAPARDPGQDDAEPRTGPTVRAGGWTRGGMGQDGQFVEATPIELDDQTIELREALRRQGLAGDDLRRAEQDAEALMQRRARMVEIRAHIMRDIETQRRRLDDPTLDPAQRREALEQLSRAYQNLSTAQSQIEQIDLALPAPR